MLYPGILLIPVSLFFFLQTTAGPGSDDPEHDPSTPANNHNLHNEHTPLPLRGVKLRGVKPVPRVPGTYRYMGCKHTVQLYCTTDSSRFIF